MTKLVFVAVLAFLAFQSSDAHLMKVKPREIFASNVQELIAELKKLIEDTSSRFTKIYDEVKVDIAEIEDKANFPGLLVDFKQQVEQLMAQEGADSCDSVTSQQVLEVEELATVFSCNIEIDKKLSDLKNKLDVLLFEVSSVLEEFGRDVFTCIKESHGNLDNFNQCMEQYIINAKQEVQAIEGDIEETFQIIEQAIPVFTDKFSACIFVKREKLVAKIEEAEETIKSCVSGNNSFK